MHYPDMLVSLRALVVQGEVAALKPRARKAVAALKPPTAAPAVAPPPGPSETPAAGAGKP